MRDGAGSSLHSNSSPCPQQGLTRGRTAGLRLAFPGVWARESSLSAFPGLRAKAPGVAAFEFFIGDAAGVAPTPSEGHLGPPAL